MKSAYVCMVHHQIYEFEGCLKNIENEEENKLMQVVFIILEVCSCMLFQLILREGRKYGEYCAYCSWREREREREGLYCT